jgi:hypothetical protein
MHQTHLAVLGDVLCDLKVPKGSGSLCVDNPLRDPLSVKASHLVEEGVVLEEKGAARAHAQRVHLVVHGAAIARGEQVAALKPKEFHVLVNFVCKFCLLPEISR